MEPAIPVTLGSSSDPSRRRSLLPSFRPKQTPRGIKRGGPQVSEVQVERVLSILHPASGWSPPIIGNIQYTQIDTNCPIYILVVISSGVWRIWLPLVLLRLPLNRSEWMSDEWLHWIIYIHIIHIFYFFIFSQFNLISFIFKTYPASPATSLNRDQLSALHTCKQASLAQCTYYLSIFLKNLREQC